MTNYEILSKLTINQKVKWTSGNDLWRFLGNKDLGIKEILLADGPHGVRVYKSDTGNHTLDKSKMAESTMFPSETAMASTFNEELIYKVGETIGKECNMFNVDVLLGPGVNLKRSPLAGRNFEYYSEDPYLSGRMAVSFINGVQSTGVGTCIKHFALNEQETQRRFINTIVDERTMHEYYLMPFEMALKEANPYAIMSSYNKVNGHYASESSYLLKNILRDKWGYQGTVISDWGAVQDKVKSIKNGMNIEMPGDSEFNQEVYKAIERNELSEKEIDESLLPLLDLEKKIKMNQNRGMKTDLVENHNIARKVAEEAIVLLENNDVLPLKDVSKIGVIGTFAKKPRISGGGSASLLPHIIENPFDELKKKYSVDYSDGYIENSTSDELLNEVKEVCINNEYVLYFTGTTDSMEFEGKDKEHMNLPKGHLKVYEIIKKYAKKIIVILSNGSALDLTPVKDADAIIEAWFLGGANGKALVDIIDGTVNPSGRLSETFPYTIESTPHFKLFPSLEDDVYYHGDIINNGYRFYDTHNIKVRYPFGYGKSYSKFKYLEMTMNRNEITNGESLNVSVSVMNNSNVDGFEVIQLYIRDIESYYPRPYKELKRFKKVFIKAKETVTVEFELNERDFSVYSVDFEDFRVEEGMFEILIGKNSMNMKLKETILYKTDKPLRKNLTLSHPLKNFFLYKPDSVNYMVDKYREFPWYEIEEPALRVLKRIKEEFNISDNDFKEILNKMV